METSVNNKCRAFTSLEQSRKLAEFLPLESADGTWVRIAIADESLGVPEEYRHSEMPFKLYSGIGIPSWSLAALLGLMPRIEHLKPFIDLSPKLNSEEVAIYYHSEDSPYIVRDNPVDACVAMIEKLHEQNLL